MGRLHDVESRRGLDDEESSQSHTWMSLLICCAISYSCMLLLFIGVCFPEQSLAKLQLLPLFIRGSSPALFYAFSHSPGRFRKPKNLEVVALVPFRESQRTEILNCYLQKNLADNNGLIDQVVFIPQTNDTENLRWLTSVVEQTPSYSIPATSSFPFQEVHGGDQTLLVWIDGDVVFLEDNTIPTMVKTKLDHPDSLIVSANVVNQAALERLHNHPSIALPYRPEVHSTQPILDRDGWRASALLRWNGPEDFQVHKRFPPSFKNHRWLPSNDEDFNRTPIGMSLTSEDGPGIDDWTVKAQQHYSFLHHLELGDLHRYKFPLWTNPSDPISRNFFCFSGDDTAAVESLFRQNDSFERPLETFEKANNGFKDVIIDGKGLAVHYFTGHGSDGLDHTDVLQRYLVYSREMVCPKPRS